MDVLNRGLKVMDPTSITFCMDNHLPIVVFDALVPGNLGRVLAGEDRRGRYPGPMRGSRIRMAG